MPISETLAVIRLLDMAVNVAVNAGVSWTKYQTLKSESGGELTDEQIQQLADEAQSAINQL